tara:strand:- start:250 stop:663 length:414 start_codon:yes stop_codon:yes gene_type:complete
MLEKIIYKKKVYALLIRSKNQFRSNGVNFVTKNKDLLQLGFISHKKNHIINPHIHKKNKRIINYCTEVLLIKEGTLKVEFYSEKGINIKKDKKLYKNDILILFRGGHGFEVTKDCKIVEIKQGPYTKKSDKVLFDKN